VKVCTKCRSSKPFSEFRRCSRAPDGFEWWCKGCRGAYDRAWKAANPSKAKEYSRAFYVANLAKPRRDAVCEECGVDFSTARRDQRFCSDRCGHRHHRRLTDHVRRAKKVGASTASSVSLEVIRERDGNRCGICGRRVGRKSHPHPESPSLDHIVPLGAGGAHEAANLQLAHLSCNLRKGARGGGEQLMLYG